MKVVLISLLKVTCGLFCLDPAGTLDATNTLVPQETGSEWTSIRRLTTWVENQLLRVHKGGVVVGGVQVDRHGDTQALTVPSAEAQPAFRPPPHSRHPYQTVREWSAWQQHRISISQRDFAFVSFHDKANCCRLLKVPLCLFCNTVGVLGCETLSIS